MRHSFEDSLNMNIPNWKIHGKINSIMTWSSWKVEFLSRIKSFMPLSLNAQIIYFQSQIFYLPFMFLTSTGFNFFAKIMGGNYVFCCSVHISFNPTSQIKLKQFSVSRNSDLEVFYKFQHLSINWNYF